MLDLSILFLICTFHITFAWHDHTKMCICPEAPGTVNNRDSSNCNSWCENSVDYNITKNDRGIIHLSISHPSISCLFDSFEIDLEVIEGKSCQESTGETFLRHTNRHFSIIKDLTECSSCTSSLELNFDYVFTGCYRLRVLPRTGGVSNPSCFSHPFHIITNYDKAMIREPKISLQTLDSSSKIDLLLREGDLSVIAQLKVILENASDGILVKDCLVPQSNWRQQILPPRDVIVENVFLISKSNCSCNWFNETDILCSFLKVDDGKYRIRVKAYDTRCHPQTLWISNCEWFSNETELNHYQGANSVDDVLKYSGFTYFPIIIIAGCLLLFYIFIILFYILWKMRDSRKTSSEKYYNQPLMPSNGCDIDTVDSQRKEIIVLLYPRDCQPFMDVMNKLHNLLSSLKNIQVLDPLNINLQEEVEMNINTWGLKHVKDPAVKFILVASKCALKLEDGLLTNHRYKYSERRPFDTVFISLLNQLYHEEHPYKKIYVVRLDCDRGEDLCYQHLCKCTNFTLPQCIKTLMHHILGLPSDISLCIDDQQDQLLELVESIRQYNLYLRENPNYLHTLFTES